MIQRSRRHLTVLLVVLAGAAGPIGLAAGQGSGGDTSAVAINTKDGSSVFKLAFQIRRVTGDVVDNQNAAVAYASCTECQTVAISIQVLLIAGSPTVFTPQNVALAINDQCTLCDTMALAYQFAVGLGTRLKFTHEGSRQIAQLRRQLEQLRNSGLSIEDIRARASEIVQQLSTVLATELVGVKPTQAEGEPTDEQDATTPTNTTTAPPDTTVTTPPPDTTPTDTTPAPPDTTTTTTPADTTSTPAATTP